MDESDVLSAIQTGNTVALQWYILTHPASTNLIGSASSTIGGTTVSTGSNSTLLLLGLLGLAAYVVTR